MALRIRVKDFQSIEDAEVLVKGLTVITGPNNSGKTAFMRAVRGLFTNAPAGPLVRRGKAFLSVEIEFDDGTVILWEKGWEKPGGRGKTVNQYTLNGTKLASVGQGVPPEVEALGVHSIEAASHRVWPQIAQQFDGALFLINRPGSTVAEALSDVERVGKLTGALKLSEKDRRSAESELKIRRADKMILESEVALYEGLDLVRGRIQDLDLLAQGALSSATELSSIQELRVRWNRVSEEISALEGFDPDLLDGCDPQAGLGFSSSLKEATDIRTRWVRALGQVGDFEKFEFGTPDSERVLRLQVALARSSHLLKALDEARTQLDELGGASIPEFPDAARAEKLNGVLRVISDLSHRWKEAEEKLESLGLEGIRLEKTFGDLRIRVQDLLEDRGICPTCDSIHSPGEHL